ncbi:GbsR/MarR family transcriptional regulator [Herbaspirillum sp. RTI4]|uniref:GbsR/MarR family transcriptional regulator n=1 Tax=Herbaspirillum sp. RTI4 TaxID=3048640 RepID=UPI002AB4CF43|nr:GbsR/MarR family transcriptional regulator [Herbaspirillum sp. RTI4]MDY7579497.1 GbsR/MarR family transcriptional regulator [Herbaspirillum sp. RTI4]MEA9980411.1 GbsR/MarR family transcriptional regulator [Herbaspirillum sp. RTI4]
MQRFISHFGEMGSRWGINRTVGQMYALLYVLGRPLNADEIAEYLGFSRSNVSMGLKELQSWRLVKLLHQPGDRREYFEPPKDIWDIFKALLEERRRREIEPTLSMLRDALLDTPVTPQDKEAQQRLREMYDLIELSSSWFDDVQRLSPDTLTSLMKMGSKIKKLLDVRDKFRFSGSKKSADDEATEADTDTDTDADADTPGVESKGGDVRSTAIVVRNKE